jgi:fumarate hydratase class II
VIEYRTLQYFSLQEAALKLGMLTSEEFDTLVVPEKMIGPTD